MVKVSVKNLSKVYKDGVHALNNINFDVNDGEFVSLIGMSGAGKTSLIRIINGSIKPTFGDVLINEKSIVNAGKKQRLEIQKKIGTVYQDFCLVDGLTCYENVINGCLAERNLYQTLTGSFTKEQKEYADLLLNQVGLFEKRNVRAKELSGGQKQRTAIARAMMQKSEILLADEPVASLDPYTSEQILELIKKMQDEYNLTVIMNSHNVEASLKYSDMIVGIRQGETVLDKKASDVNKNDLGLVYGDTYGKNEEV